MSYSFNMNGGQVVNIALQMMNVTSITDATQASDYNYTLTVLNMMLKSWAVDGFHLWKRKQGVLFLNYNQNSYELGSVTGNSPCAPDNGYVATTSTATITSGNTIVLTTVTGMSIGDNIGIELDNLSRQWTTITNINTGTLTITFTTPVSSQATSGNTVITYTTAINRPLEVLRGTRLDLSVGTEIEMEKMSYDKYYNTPIKTTLSPPIGFYYSKLLNNSLPYTGTLLTYLTPDTAKYIFKFSYLETIRDLISSTDIIDFPQEWLLAITTNLAVLLAALGYGKLIEAQATTAIAASEKTKLLNFDADDEYLTIDINNTTNRNM